MLREADILVIDRVWVGSGKSAFRKNAGIAAIRLSDREREKLATEDVVPRYNPHLGWPPE